MIGYGVGFPGIHQVASSVIATSGNLIGTVADIQNFQDGNALQVEEAAATPGFEVDITFTNISRISRIGVQMFYLGSATHWVEIEMWDYVLAAPEVIWTFSSGLGENYRYSDIPGDRNRFINSSGEVMVKIHHPSGGNASHDAFVGYAALIT